MNLIAFIVTITLTIAGLFHFYWALGGKLGLDRAIPTVDGQALFSPGKILTVLVGFIILSFAWIAYNLGFNDLSLTSYSQQIIYAGWFLSGIFFLRTIGDFHSIDLFKKIKSTKFSEFDTKYFIPLTLFWAISFGLLTYQVS
ncbi:MAG: DUF3995 domain-containing protein [Sulfurovum sp.]|nr:DUF3995 domain-containing protein [Sulfurovum sp.]